MCQQIFQWDPDMRQLWLWTVLCSKVRTSSFHGVFVLLPRGRTMPSLWQSGTQCSVQRWLYLEQLLRSCCKDGVCPGGRAGNEWKGRESRRFPSPLLHTLPHFTWLSNVKKTTLSHCILYIRNLNWLIMGVGDGEGYAWIQPFGFFCIHSTVTDQGSVILTLEADSRQARTSWSLLDKGSYSRGS